MSKIYKGFIESFDNGATKGSWTDSSNWSDEWDTSWERGAGIISDEVVLLDFDEEEDFKRAYIIVQEFGLKPKLNHKNHHMIFRRPKDGQFWKRTTHQTLFCGVECDFLVSNSLETLKRDGVLRFDMVNNDISEIDELPIYFYPLVFPQSSKWVNEDFRATELKNGDGRYELLFKLRLALFSKGVEHKDIITTLDIINRLVFSEQIDKRNWDRLTDFTKIKENNLTLYTIENVNKDGTVSRKFLPYTFVIDQIERMHVVKHNNKSVGYVNGKWYDIIDYFDTLITDVFRDYERPEYSRMVRKQLKSIIEFDVNNYKDITWNNPRYTVFNNGTYDWELGQLIPTTYNQYQTVTIPFDFDDTVESERYTKLIHNVFGDDVEQQRAVLEMLGSGFYKSNKHLPMFAIFHGKGNNAKSLFTDAMIEICGSDNISGASLVEINTDKFATATLHNKLFNIVDDANADYSGDTGKLKSISAGSRVKIERKGEQAYFPDELPFCTILLNTNKIIRIGNGDDDFAIDKRRKIVHFTKQFFKSDDDFDPNACIDALNDVSFLQKLLSEAIKAYRNVLLNTHEFTVPSSSMNCISQFKDMMNQAKEVLNTYSIDDWCKFNLEETYQFYIAHCGTKKPKSMQWLKENLLTTYPDLSYDDEYKALYTSYPTDGMNYLLCKKLWYSDLNKKDTEYQLSYVHGMKIIQSKIGGFKSQRLKKVVNG